VALRAGLAQVVANRLIGSVMSDMPPARREPVFNVPSVILGILALLALIHLARWLFLSEQDDLEFVLMFAFIPARYDPSLLLGGVIPGGFGAQIWSFVTYSLLHADSMHLGLNALWLLAFGSAVARRFGAMRFLVFFVVTAAAGALVHLMTHHSELSPMIGASASISGAMAAAMRFAFQRGGPLGLWRSGEDEDAYRVPALPLSGVLRDPRVLAFLLVWFGVNLLFGVGTVPIAGEGQTIAWEAHIGGFLAGLLLFDLFDPKRPPAGPLTDAHRDAA
jgi:membrane associated rhomboid family serine protease